MSLVHSSPLLQAGSLVAAMNRINCSKHPRNCARDERVNSPRRAASCRPLERRKKYRRSFNLLTHAHVLSRCSVVRPCECEEEEDSSHESVLSKVYMRWDVETRCSYYWKIICTDWVDWQSWCIYVCGDLRNLYNRWDNNTGYTRREWVILVKIYSLLFPISLFVILKRYSYCKFY